MLEKLDRNNRQKKEAWKSSSFPGIENLNEVNENFDPVAADDFDTKQMSLEALKATIQDDKQTSADRIHVKYAPEENAINSEIDEIDRQIRELMRAKREKKEELEGIYTEKFLQINEVYQKIDDDLSSREAAAAKARKAKRKEKLAHFIEQGKALVTDTRDSGEYALRQTIRYGLKYGTMPFTFVFGAVAGAVIGFFAGVVGGAVEGVTHSNDLEVINPPKKKSKGGEPQPE